MRMCAQTASKLMDVFLKSGRCGFSPESSCHKGRAKGFYFSGLDQFDRASQPINEVTGDRRDGIKSAIRKDLDLSIGRDDLAAKGIKHIHRDARLDKHRLKKR